MLGKLRRPLLTLLVFALLGPLIGLVVFAFGIGILVAVGGRPDGWWLTPFLLLYGLIFAHFVGLPWALLAGATATALAFIRPDHPRWIGPLAGLVSFAIAFLTGAAPFPLTTGTSDQIAKDDLAAGVAAIVLATHVVSSTICWLISRRFWQPHSSVDVPIAP